MTPGVEFVTAAGGRDQLGPGSPRGFTGTESYEPSPTRRFQPTTRHPPYTPNGENFIHTTT
jgi:hypothetical protein